MKKALWLVAAGMIAGAIFAPQASKARTLDEIMQSGTIRAGINPTLPPLGVYNKKNEITGFDVDYAQEVADKLGVKLQVVPVSSPDRIPFLTSDRIDFMLGAMTRNAERAKVIDFTVPVYTEGLSVLRTDGFKPKTWKDLDTPDTKLIEVRGSTPVKFIKDTLPHANLTLLDSYPDVIRALAQGRGNTIIDVVDYLGTYLAKYKDVKWEITSMPVDVDFDCMGIAKGNDALNKKLSSIAIDIEHSGDRAALWQKWFGMPMTYPIPESELKQ